MRRLRTKLYVAVTMAAALTGLTPAVPGCGSFRFDPQAFFEQNACNIFNCDNLFFLDRNPNDEHEDMAGMEGMEGMEGMNGMEEEGGGHQH